MKEGSALVDMESGAIVKADRAFCKLLGVRRSQLRERRLFDLFPLIDLSPHKEQWEGRDTFPEENFGDLEIETRDGRRFAVEFTPKKSPHDRKPLIQCEIRDITEEKRRETKCWRINRQLKIRIANLKAELSSANRELEALGFTFARHFQEPLRQITTLAERLRHPARAHRPESAPGPGSPNGETSPDGGDATPPHERANHFPEAKKLSEVEDHELSMILHCAKTTEAMIGQLVDYLRVNRSELKKSTADLRDLFLEAWSELESRWKDQPVRWIIHPLPMVHADPQLLKEALKNLLSNAIKFSSWQPESRIEIGASCDDSEEVVIFIKDNGIGFDSKDAEYLFGIFHRLNPRPSDEGTGVGLAHADRIIHRHGGNMWAEGRPGGGATFSFSLPEY